MLGIQELASDGKKDGSLHDVARICKAERQNVIFNGNNEEEKRVSAATEISRVWRGYWCR